MLSLTLLAAPLALLHGPGLAYIPNLYAASFQLTLTQISLALLASRLFCDALASALVGEWSDRTQSRLGQRKPWIIAGSVLALIGIYQLYVPGPSPSTLSLAIWLSVVYLAFNMIDVPYTAMANELSSDYVERARISVWYQSFIIVGLIALAVVPLLASPVHELDFASLKALAWISIAIMPLALAWMVFRVPHAAAAGTAAGPAVSWRSALVELARNRPFAAFIGLTVVHNLGQGTAVALLFLFFASYLKLGSWFSLVVIATGVVSLLAMPLCNWLLVRSSKERLLVVSSALTAAALLAVWWLDPGPWALPFYIAFEAAILLGSFAFTLASRAMLGDLADYGRWKTGHAHLGQYSGIWTMVGRATNAIAGSAGFALAGWFGYDPRAGAADGDSLGLKLAISVVPAIVMLASVVIAAKLPLTRRRHAAVQRRLLRREAAAGLPADRPTATLIAAA